MKTILTSITLLLSIILHAQQPMVLQAGTTNVKDAWIWSFPQASAVNFGVPNSQNGGLHNVLRSESWQWAQGRFDTIRSLISFDLSALPTNATIDSAKLNLYFFKNPNFTSHSGNNLSLIHPITSNWNEATVNWQNQPQYDNSIFATLPTSSSSIQNYIGIDVTTLVIDQIQNHHFGWLIKLQNESGFNGLTFASSDHLNVSLRPMLTIYYRLSTSLKDIRNKSEFSVFPNPSSQEFFLESSSHLPTGLTLECYNSKGELQNIEFETIGNKVRFDLKHQSAGIYFLKIRNKKEVHVLRCIKQ